MQIGLYSFYGFLEYILITGIYFIICYVLFKKTLESAKIQKKEISKKDIRREILHSCISTTVMSVIILSASSWTNTKMYYNIDDYPIAWLIGSVFIGLILHDTYFYWLHRTLHHPFVFRFAHLVHHKSTNPSPFAAYSFNIIEAIGESLIVVILIYIMPMHDISVHLFIICSLTVNVYGHLGYETAPKWFRTSFLFKILNSSVYHNLHHSKFKGNYSLYFRFWDQIMKTENPDYIETYDKIQQRRFGGNKK